MRFEKKSWKEFGETELNQIEKERMNQIEINSKLDQKVGQWGKLCRACDKPNSLSTNFCTGCSFSTKYFFFF
jgi:hypothetical protein